MATKATSSRKKSTVTKPKAQAATASTPMAAMYQSVYKALKDMPLIGKIISEFVGAFLITTAFLEMQGNPLFAGFALAGVVLVVGGVSGAHVNPAMTFGAWATRKMTWLHALGYVVAQLLGASVAYLVLNTFLHENGVAASTAGAPVLFHAATVAVGKEWYVFFAELLATAILGLGVATALRMKKNKIVSAFAAGLAFLTALYIGMSLTTVLLTEANVSLTFLNPAVAFAANGLSWNWWPIAIYVLAPVLGGLVGFGLADFFHSQSEACDCEECK